MDKLHTNVLVVFSSVEAHKMIISANLFSILKASSFLSFLNKQRPLDKEWVIINSFLISQPKQMFKLIDEKLFNFFFMIYTYVCKKGNQTSPFAVMF